MPLREGPSLAAPDTAGPARSPDLLVIGGGIIGLASAWRAAQHGATVTVVAEGFATGASFAAAGMVAPVSEAHFGEEALLGLNLRSARSWPAFAEELEARSGVELGYLSEGTLAVAFDSGDRAVLDELWKFQVELGLDSARVPPSACRELEPLLASGIRGGLLVRSDHQVDPRRVTAALLEACRAEGVRLLEDAVAELVVCQGGGRAEGVRLASGGEIRAARSLLAAGWQSSRLPGLPPAAVPPVRPVKGQILRLRLPDGYPSPTRTLRGVVQGHSVYLVPRRGELVCGATSEELGADVRVTAGAVYELLRDAQAVLPCVSEAALVETVAALRPGTPDNAPIIGPSVLDGLFVATGHFRHGILLTPVTAELVAGLLLSGHPELPDWAAVADPRRFGDSAARAAAAR